MQNIVSATCKIKKKDRYICISGYLYIGNKTLKCGHTQMGTA